MYELVFLTGARAGEVVPVTGPLVIGREASCSLHTPDPAASRLHARLSFDGAALHVKDEGSANGTYVGNRRVGAAILEAGDVLKIGDTRLKVRRRGGADRPGSGLFAFNASTPDPTGTLQVSAVHPATLAISADVRLQAVLDVSQALVNIESLDATSAAVLEALFRVFPQADRGFLMLGSDPASLRAEAYRVRGEAEAGEVPSVSSGICRKVLESRNALLFDDRNPGDIDTTASIHTLLIRSAMAVPLMVGGEVLGLLQVDTADGSRAFQEADLEVAVAVGRQAAIAVRNALLVGRVEAETRNRDNLLRFLPGPLVEQALAGRLDFSLGGRIYLATVLFSDLVGFTALSERLPPEEVVALMNRYFDRMVPCIEAWGGSVDKFIGDAIMAVWGILGGRGEAAHGACQAALAMQTALVAFNSVQPDAGPELGMRIGVNTGSVVGGNIGTETRKEYTVLGDAVNTAQRLESAASRNQVVVAASTWEALKGAGRGLALPPLAVKNKATPLAAYSLRGLAVEGEVSLHVPVACGAHPAWIIRRLPDRSFVVLHPAGSDLRAAPLVSAAVEWPDVDLGRPLEATALPVQASDGTLVRSQVRLAEDSLGGLLEPKG